MNRITTAPAGGCCDDTHADSAIRLEEAVDRILSEIAPVEAPRFLASDAALSYGSLDVPPGLELTMTAPEGRILALLSLAGHECATARAEPGPKSARRQTTTSPTSMASRPGAPAP